MFELFPELKERAAQKAGTLSGGQQQMVALARALLNADNRILLIDEPTKGLSPLFVGRVAVALAIGQIEDPAFDVIPFAEDRLVLVVPASGHRLSKRRTIRAEELESEVFVAREAGSATRIIAERELVNKGVHVTTQMVVPSLEGVSRAVEAGLGVAILSWLVVERAVEEGRVHVVEIKDLDLRRAFKIVSLKDRTLSPMAADFVKFLQGSAVLSFNRRSRPRPLPGPNVEDESETG